MKLWADWEEKAYLCQKQERKVPNEFFIPVLLHLLNLYPDATKDEIPPLLTYLETAKEHHQLMVLQQSLDNTSLSLGICVPMVASPALLHIAVGLLIILEGKDNLITGINPFPWQQRGSHYAPMKSTKTLSQAGPGLHWKTRRR